MCDQILRILSLTGLVIIGGCGSVEQAIKRNDDRYAVPGAMDAPLTGLYKTYQYKLLERYQVTHQWLRTTGCSYRSVEQVGGVSGHSSWFFSVRDIYEQDDKTWQRFDSKIGPYNFSRYVRSVTEVSREKETLGQIREIGWRPICFEYWDRSSHFLRLRLQRRSLPELQAVFSEQYPEAGWSTRVVQSKTWMVQALPEDQLRPKEPGRVGGPFENWLIPLGDTGYTLAIEMGANQESLKYPEAQRAVHETLMHLVASVQVEPLAP
ncbi:hypothetical protein [Variovorax sp. HJSM1_2]|uniref:hypothetical protein n=1 Tax=Variovorax sp. HJSM1_2 TaxID=3366263 RepID=UPI003BCE16A5